jgi:hypothetical protein
LEGGGVSETTHTSKLVEVLRRGIPYGTTFKHADRFTHGVPDISHTAFGFTSWWEVKLADPTFDCPGIQELTLKRLAKNSFHARVIIFREDPKGTFIVHPDHIHEWDSVWEHYFPGYAYVNIYEIIKYIHASYAR